MATIDRLSGVSIGGSSIKTGPYDLAATAHVPRPPIPENLLRIMSRHGIETPPANGRLTLKHVDDQLAGQSMDTRINVKSALARAGLL